MPLKLTKANKNREILTDRRSAQKPRRSVAGEHRARRNSDGQLRQRAARAETRVLIWPLRRNPNAQLAFAKKPGRPARCLGWGPQFLRKKNPPIAGGAAFCAGRTPPKPEVRLSARDLPATPWTRVNLFGALISAQRLYVGPVLLGQSAGRMGIVIHG